MWEFNNDSTYEERDYILRKAREQKGPGPGYPGPGPFCLSKFIESLPKLVDIICYCLIPNHYHFILKQLVDDGIEKFMHKLGTGYAGYLNKNYDRKGMLFERPFEAYPINSEGKLWWLSAYVNCNYEIHKLGKAEDWTWSSYLDYIGKRNGKLCNKDIILFDFMSVAEYEELCKIVIEEAQDIKRVREFLVK